MEARVIECVRKEFDGRAYYVLMVQGEGFPMGKVSSNNEYKVGQTVRLGFGRRESDMKLTVRVL